MQRHFEEAAENVFDCEKLLLKISENSQEITCGGVQLPQNYALIDSKDYTYKDYKYYT